MTTRWAPTALEEVWVGDIAGIRLTTNTAARLFLRSTRVEPVKTLIPKEKRGAVWYYDNKMCFVVYQDCQQDEPGDSMVHTFSCPVFTPCVPVWYYFWGTIGGNPSPSNTAIFRSHLTWPSPPACNMPAPPKTLVGAEGIARSPMLDALIKTLVGAEGIAFSPALNTPTKSLTI